MKRIVFFYFPVVFLVSSGCKTFKNISSRDTSGKSENRSRAKNEEVTFIDDAAITPGSRRTTTVETKKHSRPAYAKDIGAYKSASIDNATGLQIKYAIMLDVPVEELSNAYLFEDIDYWWGTKYCFGGEDENCIDCSSFTQTIIRDVYTVHIPRTSKEQYDSSDHINEDELQQGDLVFFKTTGKAISHVGLYLTNNKFVHASVSSGVMISDLNEPYWKQRFAGAGKVIKHTNG